MSKYRSWSSFPDEIKVMISERCDAMSLIQLEAAFPDLRSILSASLKTNILFEKVFGVLYECALVDLEVVKISRLVCRRWCEAVDKYFAETNFYSLDNIKAAQNKSAVVLWLPVRKTEAARLAQMTGHTRCPSFGKKLVIKYPFLERDECLSIAECYRLIRSLSKFWNSFSHLEILRSDRWIDDWRFKQQQDELAGAAYWDSNICSSYSWFLPILDSMENLVSIKGGWPLRCLSSEGVICNENFSSLKWILLGEDRRAENYSHLIEKCAGTLEMIELVSVNHAVATLGSHKLPHLRELLVTSGRCEDFYGLSLNSLRVLGLYSVTNEEQLKEILMQTPNLENLFVGTLERPSKLLATGLEKMCRSIPSVRILQMKLSARNNEIFGALFPDANHFVAFDHVHRQDEDEGFNAVVEGNFTCLLANMPSQKKVSLCHFERYRPIFKRWHYKTTIVRRD